MMLEEAKQVLGWLFFWQVVLQLLMMAVRAITGKKRHFLLYCGVKVLGVVVKREQEDKDREDGLLGCSLLMVALWCCFPAVNLWQSVCVVGVVNLLRVWVLLKLYPWGSGRGLGLNFYWRGQRILGIDWHRWVRRREGKRFLKKEDQFYLNRPHLDIPQLQIHHWPWETKNPDKDVRSEEEVKDAKADGEARKEMKKVKKEAKLERRKKAKLNTAGGEGIQPELLNESTSGEDDNLLQSLWEQDSDW